MTAPDKSDLVQWLIREISYDGDSGEVCPNCKYQLEAPAYWWYHRDSLKSNLERKLGVRCRSILDDILESIPATGQKEQDAEQLADAILREVFIG